MNKWLLALIIALLMLCCCLIFACVLTGGLAVIGLAGQPTSTLNRWPTPTAEGDLYPQSDWGDELHSTATPVPQSPTLPLPTPQAMHTPAAPDAYETLKTLKNVVVPSSDPKDLALRLKGSENIPTILPTIQVMSFKEGDQNQFWATNMDTNENFPVTATLRKTGQHAYFWVENGLRVNQRDINKLIDEFDHKIYPTNRAFFGSEWNPGIDGDPRLYIMYVRGLGKHIGGYFSSVDSLHPLVHKYSNAHEMFFINADTEMLDEEYTYGTLAHEFQHMIHWYLDRNEDSWVNEGFSMLAELINDYNVGGFDVLFVSDPDISLVDWPNDPNATSPHYGSSFLFMSYFLGRFGSETTRLLVAHPENGLEGVDTVLTEKQVVDPLTGKPITADDVFADWAVANYLNNPSVGDGRYAYTAYKDAPSTFETEGFGNCPLDWQDRTVSQYGTDYIRLDCSGNFSLKFEGSNEVRIVPTDPYSGQYAFWSNKGDESDMTLTRTFDFRQVSGAITLTYQVWFDIEKDYDYLYLLASLDGEHWTILKTPSGTDRNPSGNAYGWGYNGVSNGWIEERVDLSQFAGKEVLLRFEYVTDAAVNGEGLLLDDISIPEIGYTTDFEQDDGGWQAAGFVRIQNRLPQTFRLSLIKKAAGRVKVEPISLADNQTASLSLEFGSKVDEAILVVSGTTRFTRQTAGYRFSVSH